MICLVNQKRDAGEKEAANHARIEPIEPVALIKPGIVHCQRPLSEYQPSRAPAMFCEKTTPRRRSCGADRAAAAAKTWLLAHIGKKRTAPSDRGLGQWSGPAGVWFASWRTASVIRRHTASPL